MPAAYCLAVRLERRAGAIDVDAGHLQLLDEVHRFVRIVLRLDRDQNRGRIAFPAVLDA